MFLAASIIAVNAYDRYAGYQPTTLITDVAAIDLDQEEFNKQTGERELFNAMKVYEMGGHSGSYAELFIQNATVAVNYTVGTIIRGITSNDDAINGTLLEPVIWKAGASSPVMKVLYDVGPLQIEYSDCQVGGLFTFGAAEKGGCTFHLYGICCLLSTNSILNLSFLLSILLVMLSFSFSYRY
jgi:hypothetical protein